MTVPGASDLATCVYCPKLCRHVCPVAVATSREAAAPSLMALHPFRFLRGEGTAEQALAAAALCLECGACTAHCDLHRPLGEMLGQVRRALTPAPVPEAVAEVEGEGRHVAIEADERRWAEALARHLGEPVARLRTGDHLGAAALAHPNCPPTHRSDLRRALDRRVAVVADHRSLAAARAAGIQVRHLAEVVGVAGEGPVHRPCAGPQLEGPTPPLALACCGANGGLREHHPGLALEVAQDQGRRLRMDLPDGTPPVRSPDATCAGALRQGGLEVVDPVSTLLAARPA